MADRKLTVVVDAKNKTQAGLDAAGGALSRFAKTAKDTMAPLRNLWQAVYGPIGLAIAAVLLFQKAMRGLTGILTAAGTATRKLEAEKAAKDFTAWGKAVSGLSAMFQTMNRDLKNWREGTKAQGAATDDLAKAEREQAKAKAMAAATTDEEREKIQAAYDIEEKRIAAVAKVESIKEQIKQSDEDAAAAQKMFAANDKKSLEIIEQREAAEARLKDISEKVAQEKKLGTVARGGDDYIKQLENEQKEAQAAVDKIAEAESKLFDETDALRAEQSKRAKLRAAQETALKAAQVEAETRQIEGEAYVEQKALEETQKKAKEHEKEVAELQEQKKEVASKIADEIANDEKQNHEAFIAQQKEQIAEREKVAQASIQDIVAEARADKDKDKAKEKEAARIKRNKDKEKRGIKLSKKEREFMDAVEKRELAEGGIKGAQDAILQAQGKVGDIEKAQQQARLDELQKEEARITATLEALALQQAALDEFLAKDKSITVQSGDSVAMAQQQATLEELLAEDKSINSKLEALLALG